MQGPDWRVPIESLRGLGFEKLFAPELDASAPVVADIGFGRGEFLFDLAQRQPEGAFLGIEYSFKRVLKLARRLARSELRNVRLIEAPAQVLVEEFLPEASLSGVWINFPDPWPKKRHHRRRLMQAEFIRGLTRCLRPAAEIHVATDHPEYALQIDEVLRAEALLENLYTPEPYLREVSERMPTAYELAWREQGRSLHFFGYRRRAVRKV